MQKHITRRCLLKNTATGLGFGLLQGCYSPLPPQSAPRMRLRKALVIPEPNEDTLKKVRDAGFDGFEALIAPVAEAQKTRAIADGLGLRIHSVMFGWAKFNSDKNDQVNESISKMNEAIEAARAYGANTVLLVPGRIDIETTPKPWEFNVRFNRETGHLATVVDSGNDRYSKYIAAHNFAHEMFLAAINKLIPKARQAGVVIAIENVWNNMFVDPHHMAHFVDSFHSPYVRAYFDIGNHVKYSPPEDWIRILGRRIIKCHVKDFKLKPDGQGGKFANIRDGSVDWPIVMAALRRIGYNGWMTIEESASLSLQERSKRLDLILEADRFI
ncbi:MAG: sugar phosphate isomerase/epimerase family protein [Planctomycetota bacterium]|jgi:hexulose-6-phosphate isomerase